jgi:hypothetical protein
MRPKRKRQRVCQSISSAFSRLSSPLVHSLVYEKEADDKLAIWASKTYWGHHMPPKDDMLADYNQNNN